MNTNLKLRGFVLSALEAAERLTRFALSLTLFFFYGRFVFVPCFFACLYQIDPLGASMFAMIFGATVLTNGGKAVVIDLIIQQSSAPFNYIGWGTGAGTAAATDTTLFTASADEARTAGAETQTTTTVTDDTYTVIGTITCASSGKTITNSGLFNDSTAGTLCAHGDFTGITLLVGDSISHTWAMKQA